jgi:glycosyltransferase involved in cell wall biosynthesis
MQVVNNLDIGGAQEVVRTLSAYLIERGSPTVVCTLRDGPLRSEIEAMGITVEVLPGRSHSFLSLPMFLKEIAGIRKGLIRLVQKYQIDVIQTHLLRSLDFLVASLKLSYPNLLIFWTVHNYLFELRADQLPGQRWLLKPKRFIHNALYRMVANRINGFIAVSDEVEQAIQQTIRVDQRRIVTICNGVDVRRYQRKVDRIAIRESLDLEEDDQVMILVGTLKEQKGHYYLIQAAAPLIAQNNNLHILFPGDGPLRTSLQQQVQQLGLEKNIHFLGSRKDIPDLLAASDYFVLPSLWEGLAMALIEAMASGLPVLATCVSGSQHVVVSGETGLLVPPGDVDQLRQAISEMIANPERAKKMGQAGSTRAEAIYGAGKQADEHLALYQREWRKISREE